MVIVLFWSFGCEASLVRVRQVQDLVAQGEGDVVGVAVHTPRFPYEEDLSRLRSAVAQHQISLAVVHDPDYVSWSRYHPQGWPATLVIDPKGRVLGTQWGLGDPDLLGEAVATAREDIPLGSDSTGPGPVPAASPLTLPGGDLAFPTAVATRANGELVVADSAHNRLLIFELAANHRSAVAVAEVSGFDQPNAVATDGADGIYVAERFQGRISHLDLAQRRRRILTDHLVGPTGLALDDDGSLAVSDGGADKLYRIVDDGNPVVTMGCIAGTGRTGTTDGAAGEAELAQPAGLTRSEVGLVVCDSASNNLRLLTDRGNLTTITGNGFFDWGLIDGLAHKALLQRPSDVAMLSDGSVVIVDTGNNRLRRLAQRRIRTLGLSGLERPSSVCLLPSGYLVVADTGHNRLVVADPALHSAWPLALRGVVPPTDPHPSSDRIDGEDDTTGAGTGDEVRSPAA